MSPPNMLPLMVTTPVPRLRVKSLIPFTGSVSIIFEDKTSSSVVRFFIFIFSSCLALVADFSPCSPEPKGMKYPTVLKSSKKYLFTTLLMSSFVTALILSPYVVYRVQSPLAIASFRPLAIA